MDEVISATTNSHISTEADHPMNVYIWDMDETLILLNALLDGSFGEAFECLKDQEKGIEIWKQWENLILELCDEQFFYEEIENYNEPYLNSLSQYDDGKDLTKYDFEADCFSSHYDDANKRKLAYRQRAVGEKYAKVSPESPYLTLSLCCCMKLQHLRVNILNNKYGGGQCPDHSCTSHQEKMIDQHAASCMPARTGFPIWPYLPTETRQFMF